MYLIPHPSTGCERQENGSTSIGFVHGVETHPGVQPSAFWVCFSAHVSFHVISKARVLTHSLLVLPPGEMGHHEAWGSSAAWIK